MTSAQFNLLQMRDKERLVFLEGNFIAVRQEPEFIIRLFQLELFYVELFYHQVRKQAVSVRIFTDTSRLQPYFDSIDLSDILDL
ncbi:MAG: hypothetical protein ACJ749_04850 [Flavisolibacter sp.]